jgi:hypothetical protein
MNHRRLYKRITNLDRLYSAADTFTELARKEAMGSEERKGLEKLADGLWKRYRRMVDDQRKTDA